MEFSVVNRRRPSCETPLGLGAKKDGCFRRLQEFWLCYRKLHGKFDHVWTCCQMMCPLNSTVLQYLQYWYMAAMHGKDFKPGPQNFGRKNKISAVTTLDEQYSWQLFSKRYWSTMYRVKGLNLRNWAKTGEMMEECLKKGKRSLFL